MGGFAKSVSVAGLTTALLLAVAEVSVRVTSAPVSRENFTLLPSELSVPTDLPDLPYRLRPSTAAAQGFGSDPHGRLEPGATMTYRTNALGFLGPERSRAKPKGVLRIVGLGDSFAFGIGVRYEDTFLAVLERSLNADEQLEPVQVLNLGVSGYSTVNEVSLLKHFGLTLEPDLCLITFFLNDTDAGGTSAPFNVASEGERGFLRRHSRLCDTLLARLERRRAADELVASYRASFRPRAAGWMRAKAALREAQALAQEHGFRLVLAIFPVLWQLSDDYPFAGVHAAIAEFAAGLGIPVLDLLEGLQGHDGPDLWVHPNNQHPNAEAHALVARALQRFLLDEGLVR